MTEINFTSHTDAYNSAKDFYEQIRNIKNPYTLSVGVRLLFFVVFFYKFMDNIDFMLILDKPVYTV